MTATGGDVSSRRSDPGLGFITATVTACIGRKKSSPGDRRGRGQAGLARVSVRQVDGEGLAGLEGVAAAWVPAFEVLHFDVETLGHHVQRVAFAHLVLGRALRGRRHPVACGTRRIAAAQCQYLASPQAVAGHTVPALDVPDRHAVGLGDGAQVIAPFYPVAARGCRGCLGFGHGTGEHGLVRLQADQLLRLEVGQARGQQLRLGSDCADDCYSLGLFHNAGISLIQMQFPDYAKVIKVGLANQMRYTDINHFRQ